MSSKNINYPANFHIIFYIYFCNLHKYLHRKAQRENKRETKILLSHFIFFKNSVFEKMSFDFLPPIYFEEYKSLF